MHINEVDDAAGEGKLVGKQKLYSSGISAPFHVLRLQSEQFALDGQLNLAGKFARACVHDCSFEIAHHFLLYNACI